MCSLTWSNPSTGLYLNFVAEQALQAKTQKRNPSVHAAHERDKCSPAVINTECLVGCWRPARRMEAIEQTNLSEGPNQPRAPGCLLLCISPDNATTWLDYMNMGHLVHTVEQQLVHRQ